MRNLIEKKKKPYNFCGKWRNIEKKFHLHLYVKLQYFIAIMDVLLNGLRALFTKFLTPVLTREFCNPLDDWLDWLIPANHQVDYKICELTPELKSW